MKKISHNLLAVFILFFLCACVTEKKRLEICNTCPVKSAKNDSIIEKIVEVPVLVPGKPGPTVYLDNPCKHLCDSLGNLKPNIKINTVKNGQALTITSQGNGLNIQAETKDTTLKAAVKQKEVYNKERAESVKYIPCSNERTAFDGWCRWWFYITGPLIVLTLAWKLYFKRFFPG